MCQSRGYRLEKCESQWEYEMEGIGAPCPEAMSEVRSSDSISVFLSGGMGSEQFAEALWQVEESLRASQRAVEEALRKVRALRPERGSGPHPEPSAWRD